MFAAVCHLEPGLRASLTADREPGAVQEGLTACTTHPSPVDIPGACAHIKG